MKINFGTPKIEYCRSVNGRPFGQWKVLDLPKQSTSNLDTADGTTTQAIDESGKVIDQFTQAGASTLAFELFRKKGLAFPFADVNGVVSDEYAFRVSSAVDANAPAYQIDRASVYAKKTWSVADGYRKAYTVTALEPAEGDMVKDLGVTVDKDALTFTSAADSTGKTIEVEGNGTITATVPVADSWCTPTVSNGVVTVKVTANAGTTERSTVLSISDSTGFGVEVMVYQEAPAAGD